MHKKFLLLFSLASYGYTSDNVNPSDFFEKFIENKTKDFSEDTAENDKILGDMKRKIDANKNIISSLDNHAKSDQGKINEKIALEYRKETYYPNNLGIEVLKQKEIQCDNATVHIIPTSGEENNCLFFSIYNANPDVLIKLVGKEVVEEAKKIKSMQPVREAFFQKLIDKNTPIKIDQLKEEAQEAGSEKLTLDNMEELKKNQQTIPAVISTISEMTSIPFKLYKTQETNEFIGKYEEVCNLLNNLKEICSKKTGILKDLVKDIEGIMENLKKQYKGQYKENNYQTFIRGIPDEIEGLINKKNQNNKNNEWIEPKNIKELLNPLKQYIEDYTKTQKNLQLVYQTHDNNKEETIKILLDSVHYSTIQSIDWKE